MTARLLALVLAAGVLAVSTGSLFVRLAQRDVPSPAVAALRLAIAAAVLLPAAALRHRAALRRLAVRDVPPLLLAGAFLAVHFAAWIASLERTTVASSVVLVSTTPLWVALLAPLVLREPIAGAARAGIAVAFAGAVLLALGARGTVGAGHGLAGDALALLGAWAMTGYVLSGRALRARLPLLLYLALVVGAAALLLLGAAGIAGAWPAAVPPRAWAWLVLLALVPQLIGHSAFNAALRHLPAPQVAVALLGEPVGATLLALAVLGEVPAAAEWAGGALVLAGIALALRAPVPRGAGGRAGVNRPPPPA